MVIICLFSQIGHWLKQFPQHIAIFIYFSPKWCFCIWTTCFGLRFKLQHHERLLGNASTNAEWRSERGCRLLLHNVAEHIYAVLYLGYKATVCDADGVPWEPLQHYSSPWKKSQLLTRGRVFLFSLAADITCVNQQELKAPECFLALISISSEWRGCGGSLGGADNLSATTRLQLHLSKRLWRGGGISAAVWMRAPGCGLLFYQLPPTEASKSHLLR